AGVPGDSGAGSVATRAGGAPRLVPMDAPDPRSRARRGLDADLRPGSLAVLVIGPPILPLGGPLPPQPVTGADLGIGSALERVPSAEARSEHATGRDGLHDHDVQLTVQERDRDGESHPDRMYRRGALEQDRTTSRQPPAPE